VVIVDTGGTAGAVDTAAGGGGASVLGAFTIAMKMPPTAPTMPAPTNTARSRPL
jgi:hypothetical protein